MIWKRQDGYGEFVRFCMAGTVGFIVDASIVQFLVRSAGMDPYSARLISFLTAVTVTWTLNRRYTFKGRRFSSRRHEWGSYVMAMFVGGGLNYLSYALLVYHYPLVREWPVLGVAAGAFVGLFVNFSSSKFIIFKANRQLDSAP